MYLFNYEKYTSCVVKHCSALKGQKELYEVLRGLDWLWKPPCSNVTSPEASARAHQLNQTEACKTFELPLRLKAMNSTWMKLVTLAHACIHAHTCDKQTDRHTQRHTETHRDTQTHTDTHRHTHTHTHTHR